jgi:cysteine-S-conjugate beta-lyase
MDSSDEPGASHPQKAETRLVTAGRDTKAQRGFVNPPVVHGSTVLDPTAEDLHAHRSEYQYGRHGTPTTRALRRRDHLFRSLIGAAIAKLFKPNTRAVMLEARGS